MPRRRPRVARSIGGVRRLFAAVRPVAVRPIRVGCSIANLGAIGGAVTLRVEYVIEANRQNANSHSSCDVEIRESRTLSACSQTKKKEEAMVRDMFDISRRSFVKTTGALGALAACGGVATHATLFDARTADAKEGSGEEVV